MLSLLIIFAVFGNIIPYVVQAEEADSDVIVISSARELIEFANNCKYDSYSRGRTTFEMRFIALRCKDTIAPTGTIAQGVGAKQVNSLGEVYENRYGLTTSQRVYGTVRENIEGRGPCYLRTEGISSEQDESLKKAYLNMAPSQTLKWIESGKNPSEQNVEIEGTEPYIVGGHTASGYWVDTNRRTTINGLYAAGDVAGGCPQKLSLIHISEPTRP